MNAYTICRYTHIKDNMYVCICVQFPNLSAYVWGMYPTTLTPNSFSNSARLDMSVATITCRGGKREGGGDGGEERGGGEGTEERWEEGRGQEEGRRIGGRGGKGGRGGGSGGEVGKLYLCAAI